MSELVIRCTHDSLRRLLCCAAVAVFLMGRFLQAQPADDAPQLTELPAGTKPFEYVDAEIPFYPAGKSWGTMGEPLGKMQKPLAAAQSQKRFVTPVGFSVELFAAEPDIGKPLAMAWDERGRLWLAETVDYPNELQPPGAGRDRIRICADTDGDGRADRFQIFADGLSIPTSLCFARGGVIVTQAPQTLFLRDTDGDDRADERQVLFSGWGTADTHAGPSNLRYGLDNWIYGMVGYSGFEGSVGGEAHAFRQGFFRFRPDGSKLEFLRSTNNNSWGLGFSEEGVVFGSTANGNPSEYMPVANRYYEQVLGWSSGVLTGIADSNAFHPITEKVRQVDWHAGFTAGAGHALYTARAFPREYWNRTAFVCEPTGHLVATFCLEARGAGYRSSNRWNLLASDDEWSAPIAAEVGPDGSVWVIDWYNYIVQHNPTPVGYKTGRGNAYETDLRDKQHGRVYRIVYRGKPGGRESANDSHRTSLAAADRTRLVAALNNDNMLWRLHAQRLLAERGESDVAAELCRLARDTSVDDIGLNVGAMHALWTLHGLGLINRPGEPAMQAAFAALQHPSAGVRRAAIQVLPRNNEVLDALLQNKLLYDGDGQVRLTACLALAEMPFAEAAGRAAGLALIDAAEGSDMWLLDAATAAAARHDFACLQAFCNGSLSDKAQRAVRDRIKVVAEHFARRIPLETIDDLLLAATNAPPPIAEALLSGLERGWPQTATLSLRPETDAALVRLLPKLAPEARGRLVSLGFRWNSPRLKAQAVEIAAAFLSRINDETQTDDARAGAAAALIDLRKNDPAAITELLKLVSPRTSPEFASGLIEAIGRSEISTLGDALVGHLGAITPGARPTVVRVLLGRSAWTASLLSGFEEGKLQLPELSLNQKQALATHPDRDLRLRARALFTRGGALPNADRAQVLDSLLPLAKQTGDAEAGREVYARHCAKCHILGTAGTRIGPDLTGIAVHPKAELLTNIIDPSRSVEGNYRVYTVVTQGGRVLVGLLVSENRTSIELIDSEAKRHTIQRTEIDELVASNKSLMPEGFEKQVSAAELVNLLEFLSRKGKYLPLEMRKVATLSATADMFSNKPGEARPLFFDDFAPRTFEGVPFVFVDPRGGVPNAIVLGSRKSDRLSRLPDKLQVPCHTQAVAIHLLSGVSGWGFPRSDAGTVSMVVRLVYADGKTEEHPLKNGEHFADYSRRIDVPRSKLAFAHANSQIRYLQLKPMRLEPIDSIELAKGDDDAAPIVLAVTIQTE